MSSTGAPSGQATPPGDAATAVSGGYTTAPSTTNALSILESAVPSDVVASIESDFSSIVSQSSHPTSSPSPHDISLASTNPTSFPTILPPVPASSSSSSSSSATTSTSSSTTPTTLSTGTRSASSTSSSILTAATVAPSASSEPSLRSNAIAGIATGTTAGVVLIILLFIFFFRRRQQSKPIFRRRPKPDGNYVQAAWLYDPVRTPHAERSRASLLRPVQSEAEQRSWSGHDSREVHVDNSEMELEISSPSMRPVDVTSPLLERPHAITALDPQPTQIPAPAPVPASSESSQRASPRPPRDSWANSKEPWISSPLLAPQMPPASRQQHEGSPQRPVSQPSEGVSRSLSASPNLNEAQRPLTAIFEESRGQ